MQGKRLYELAALTFPMSASHEGADGEKQEGKARESLPSLLGRVLVAGMIHPTHAIVFSCVLIVPAIM